MQGPQPGLGQFVELAPARQGCSPLRRILHPLPLHEQLVHPPAQYRRHLRAYGQRLGMGKLGAVHAAGAGVQVVRLVHQHADAPRRINTQGIQHRAAVKVVVVIAHHHIAPAQHFVPEVVGADAVVQRDRAQRRAVQPGLPGRRPARGREPVVKAMRQRARLPVAGFVLVFTGLVLGHQLDHAQRELGTGRAAQRDFAQRVQRHLPTRRLGG